MASDTSGDNEGDQQSEDNSRAREEDGSPGPKLSKVDPPSLLAYRYVHPRTRIIKLVYVPFKGSYQVKFY
jgi:hypothetical protein